MYSIYLIVNEKKNKTYVGFSKDITKRIQDHMRGKVISTKNFGNFLHYIIEEVDNFHDAIQRERYWKSSSGRKKIKSRYF